VLSEYTIGTTLQSIAWAYSCIRIVVARCNRCICIGQSLPFVKYFVNHCLALLFVIVLSIHLQIIGFDYTLNICNILIAW